jgi:UDP-N-acetylmuramate--alanine ligase
MHVYFSGIGGTAIGPLALIARQAGYEVSGSDKQDSQYIDYLRKQGITDIHIGQTAKQIAAVHDKRPIDWIVYSVAVTLENNHPPELDFAEKNAIKNTERSDFINFVLGENKLKMVGVAGTHGKTTTTAMIIWLCQQIGLPISYSVGAKISFGDMGHYQKESTYFIYEADEFARNFLAFQPYLSAITGVSWDHHEIYPTREDYQSAFREYISQSQRTLLWQEDFDYLKLESPANLLVLDSDSPVIELIQLRGRYNRLDAWLAVQTVNRLSDHPIGKLVRYINAFPGLSRRMERLKKNLYSDYAHTPEKIRGAMSVALEMAEASDQPLIVIYEPLTDRRQHFVKDEYKDCFEGAAQVYWLPSYLAREDPKLKVLKPDQLIARLANPQLAKPQKKGEQLIKIISRHLKDNAMVVAMSGGGGDSLDEWLRQNLKKF